MITLLRKALTNRFTTAVLALLLATSMVGLGAVQAERQTISYSDAEPYLKLLEESANQNPKKAVTVKTHSDKLKQVDPSNLKTLTNFVLTSAEKASSGNATIVDHKYKTINGRLSLCLGVNQPDNSMVASSMFCQDFATNQLNKLVVRNGSDEVVGEYVVKFN